MKPPKLQDEYNRDDAGLGNFEPTRTQQHMKDDCDINRIMAQYTQTGLLPAGSTQQANYGDFDQVDDYLTALLTIQNAQDQFNELPAQVRARFRNDPAELLQWVQDPANLAEAQKLGMLKGEPPPPPAPPPPDPEKKP